MVSLFRLAAFVAGSNLLQQAHSMPLPWSRELSTGDSGSDVKIMQSLLNRSPGATQIEADGQFGAGTEAAVAAFQSSSNIKPPTPGVFENSTADALMDCCGRDNYKDNGTAARYRI